MTTDRHLSHNGATIAYQRTGTGPAFGYAHGVFLSREAVRRLDLFDFDKLGTNRTLLTFDQRGHGHSTGRPIPADYTFTNLAKDLLALLDAENINQLDFAGSSLGAAMALHAAVQSPNRFRSLVLLIPPVAWETGPTRARDWYTTTAEEIEQLGAQTWRRKWAAAAPLPIFADYPKYDLPPDVPDNLLPAILRGIGQSDLPTPAEIAALDHPTLILTWDTDPLHPVTTAERLHALMPNSTLHVARTAAEVQTWTSRTADFLETGEAPAR